MPGRLIKLPSTNLTIAFHELCRLFEFVRSSSCTPSNFVSANVWDCLFDIYFRYLHKADTIVFNLESHAKWVSLNFVSTVSINVKSLAYVYLFFNVLIAWKRWNSTMGWNKNILVTLDKANAVSLSMVNISKLKNSKTQNSKFKFRI